MYLLLRLTDISRKKLKFDVWIQLKPEKYKNCDAAEPKTTRSMDGPDPCPSLFYTDWTRLDNAETPLTTVARVKSQASFWDFGLDPTPSNPWMDQPMSMSDLGRHLFQNFISISISAVMNTLLTLFSKSLKPRCYIWRITKALWNKYVKNTRLYTHTQTQFAPPRETKSAVDTIVIITDFKLSYWFWCLHTPSTADQYILEH